MSLLAMTSRAQPCKRYATIVLAIMAWASAIALPASARTWRVIKDGSGDFTRIVDAMAAIADGDTVEIHPGRYAGFQQISLPGQSGPASALVTKNDITIRGTDRDAVIIGPETPNWSGFWPKGIVAYPGTMGLRIENLTVENLREGIWLTGSTWLTDLNVRGNRFGVLAFANGSIVVRRCSFANDQGEGINVSPPTQEIRISDSSFADLGTGVYLQSVPGTIDRTNFACGGIGVYAVEAASVQLVQCTADGTDATSAVSIDLGATLELAECKFERGVVGLNIQESAVVDASHCVVSGMELADLWVGTPANVVVSSSDLLSIQGHSVHFLPFQRPPFTIDVRNNYWGVESAEEIADLIWDANDGEPGVTGIALYEPFLTRSVPTQPISFGAFRLRFTKPR